jgi:hypothetical protein
VETTVTVDVSQVEEVNEDAVDEVDVNEEVDIVEAADVLEAESCPSPELQHQ